MKLLKNYDRFVILIWIFLTIVFWFRYIPDSSMLEGGLLAFCIMAGLYPFTTYLSKNLLQNAMRQKMMLYSPGSSLQFQRYPLYAFLQFFIAFYTSRKVAFFRHPICY